MVLAEPGLHLTPPPSSSPPKTSFQSYSAQIRSHNEEKTPPKKPYLPLQTRTGHRRSHRPHPGLNRHQRTAKGQNQHQRSEDATLHLHVCVCARARWFIYCTTSYYIICWYQFSRKCFSTPHCRLYNSQVTVDPQK